MLAFCVEDNHELLRSDITLVNQLGIGEYGPIYDAEVKVKKNLVSRALIKVRDNTRSKEKISFVKVFTKMCTIAFVPEAIPNKIIHVHVRIYRSFRRERTKI